MTKPLVEMRGITKRFGGVTALLDVDLEAHAGEVLAIVGDNGAGKSTLIKILTGVYQPTEGEMFLDGDPVSFASHADAIELGIDPIHLGIIMVVNMEIGMITPPVGLNLFVTAGVAQMSVINVVKAALPWVGIMFVFLIMITYIPIISTWLPTTLMGPEIITN